VIQQHNCLQERTEKKTINHISMIGSAANTIMLSSTWQNSCTANLHIATEIHPALSAIFPGKLTLQLC